MPGQEEGLPERIRHPDRESARDQQPADDVEPDRGPIHHEIVADRGETSVGRHPLPDRAALGDAALVSGSGARIAGGAAAAIGRLFSTSDLAFLTGVCYCSKSNQTCCYNNISDDRKALQNVDANSPCSLPQERPSPPCCPIAVSGS